MGLTAMGGGDSMVIDNTRNALIWCLNSMKPTKWGKLGRQNMNKIIKRTPRYNQCTIELSHSIATLSIIY
jgi:hypothetical protein